MKKTKILVPALAILALGMAASVTGTVAWFSANKNVMASEIKASVGKQQDLRIAAGHTIAADAETGWNDTLTFTKSLLEANPVAAVDASAITDVASAVGAAGSKTLTKDLKFVQPKASNTINPTTGAAAEAIKAGDNTDNYNLLTAPTVAASTTYVQEDYSLVYKGTDTEATVYFKITVGKSAEKEIDKAYRVAILFNDKKLDVYSVASGYEITGNSLTLQRETPVRLSMFCWYEGTDAACKNINAEVNQLTTRLDYSLVNNDWHL